MSSPRDRAFARELRRAEGARRREQAAQRRADLRDRRAGGAQPRARPDRSRTVARASRDRPAQKPRERRAPAARALREPRTARAGNPLRRARRAAYRTRHALAPAWCAVGVALVAWGLRGLLPAWLAVCAVLLLLAAADVRIARDSRTLRAHRAGVLLAAAAAAWACWVVVAGFGQLQAVALALATLAMWPSWWRSHRVRRARAASRFEQAWAWAAADLGLRAELRGTIPGEVDGQWSHPVDLNGDTVDRLRGALGDLEAVPALRLRRGALRVDDVPADASRAVLHVVAVDPLTSAPDVPAGDDEGIPWPGPDPAAGPDDPIAVGLYEDGGPIELGLDQHILLVGGTGAGKGTLLKILIGNALARRALKVWGIDFKGGRLLTPWGRCIAKAVTNADGYGPGIEQARALLAGALAEVDRRAAAGAVSGLDGHVATERDPHIILIIDEAERVLDDPDCLYLINELSDVARSERITLVITVKRPTADSTRGGRLSSNIKTRVLLGSRENKQDLRGALPGGITFPVEVLDRPGKAAIYRHGQAAARPGRIWLPSVAQVAELRAAYEPAETAPAMSTDPENTPENAVSGALSTSEAAITTTPVPSGPPSPALALELITATGTEGIRAKDLKPLGQWGSTTTMYEHLAQLGEDEEKGRAAQVVSVNRRWYAVEHAPDGPRPA
jgi:hypothetical protein